MINAGRLDRVLSNLGLTTRLKTPVRMIIDLYLGLYIQFCCVNLTLL